MNNEKIESIDRWRDAILAERQRPAHELMVEKISKYEGPRNNMLILSDASLINTKESLEKGFHHVTVVDNSQTLFDNNIVPNDDVRVEKIQKDFSNFEPQKNSFDFIYGKSIAFTPKKEVFTLLNHIKDALRPDGFFVATWAGEYDQFRYIGKGSNRILNWFSIDELTQLYNDAGLIITEINELKRDRVGLISQRCGHNINIVAKK